LPDPLPLRPANSADGPPDVYAMMHNKALYPIISLECAMEATKVGIREFRLGLADYIASESPVAVTRHGQTVGFFIPAKGQADADLAALKKASAELDRLLAAHSVDVEAVAAEFKAARQTGSAGPAAKKRPRRQPA
jgi:hypothetical protein